ncbi:MAG TPA: hypothetical protein VFZ91_04875 [Allosphingosinicella sp.]
MYLWTAAQALAALALQPVEAPPAPQAGVAADYVILGDEARRARLERLLARRAAAPRRLRASGEGGLYFVGCITAWRHDPGQAGACLASRLPRQGGTATIVLNSYHPGKAADGLTVTCHGLGGTGRAVFGARPRRQDATALEHCLERGLMPSEAPVRQRVGVRHSDGFAIEDPQEARRRAQRVLLVAIDHVGIPRGITGSCLVQGRVVREERGSGIRPGALVEAGIPCAARPGLSGSRRRIPMGAMRKGSFARLYLSEGHGLVDFVAAPRTGTKKELSSSPGL